jgi:DNA-binding CsgD family transcriptional regulator
MTTRHALETLIFAAALAPAAWKPLVETLLNTFRGEGGGLNVANPTTGQSLQSLDYGIPDDRHAQYYGEVYRHDPRIPAMAATRSGTAFADSELLNGPEIDRHPFYAWQAEFGYRHTLFLKLLHDPAHLGAIAITRRIHVGAPTDDELALAREIAPALAHAASVSRRLADLGAIQQGLEAALSANARAFALVDKSGTIAHANAGFAAVLARNDGLTTTNGRPRATHPRSAAPLQQALGQALSNAAGSALAIERTQAARPYRLVIEPVRPPAAEQAGFQWGHQRGALLFLDDPDEWANGSRTRALQQIHGLTAAEAQVAEAIAAGLSPEEFAERSGTRISTVRTHLKRIFHKLGVTRMSALAGIVLRLPASHSNDRS